MRALLLTWAFAGCGRVDFAAGADATTVAAHDEDGDGIPDALDNCPVDGTSIDQADRDGDGIGDLCDPHPDDGGDRVALFATMRPGDTGASDDNGGTPWMQDADALETRDETVSSKLTFPVALASTRIAIGFDILALGPATVQRQLSIGVTPADDGDRNFVELNSVPAIPTYIGATYFSAAIGYQRLDEHVLVGEIPLGPFVLVSTGDLAMQAITDDGRFAADGSEYTGTGHTVFGNGLRGGTSLALQTNALHVRVRYVWATTSP